MNKLLLSHSNIVIYQWEFCLFPLPPQMANKYRPTKWPTVIFNSAVTAADTTVGEVWANTVGATSWLFSYFGLQGISNKFTTHFSPLFWLHAASSASPSNWCLCAEFIALPLWAWFPHPISAWTLSEPSSGVRTHNYFCTSAARDSNQQIFINHLCWMKPRTGSEPSHGSFRS